MGTFTYPLEVFSAGIPEVWIVNLRARDETAYADPNGAEYATVHTYRMGESISPRAFPDLPLAVADFMPPTGLDRERQPCDPFPAIASKAWQSRWCNMGHHAAILPKELRS